MTEQTNDLVAMRALLLSELFAYPQEEASVRLDELAKASELATSEEEAWSALSRAIAELSRDRGAWRSEYIDLFDRGTAQASLHETEYGQPLAKGSRLADLAGFYRAFSFSFRSEHAEMLDHVAVELEFYALMCLKERLLAEDAEGFVVVRDARRKFFADHLGSLLCTLAEQDGLAKHVRYAPVVVAARAFADSEALSLQVESYRTPMPRLPAEDEQMACAESSRLPVVN